MEYDFGIIEHLRDNKSVKVTFNEFRGQQYVHIREYIQDLDTNEWYPTKKGIAIKIETLDVLIFVLEQISKLSTDIFYRQLNSNCLYTKQLDLFEDKVDDNNTI